MTFHSIVEQWCSSYKYMLHNPKNGNKRFYLTDSTAGVVELAKGITPELSPCVVMESSVEGGGPVERPEMNYPVYFFVRAEKMADGDEAAVAKELAKNHARNFLSWLKAKRNEQLAENIDGDFSRILLDGYVDYTTVGPLEDGWYAVLVQLSREEPLNLCVDENLYVEPCEC